LIEKGPRPAEFASTAANLKEGEAELSSEETLRVLQEITNEQR